MMHSTNPYEAPRAPSAPVAPPGASSTALFTPGHVLLASMIGLPLGGSLVWAANARRLGAKTGTVSTIFSGIIGTFLVFAITAVAVSRIPLPLPWVTTVAALVMWALVSRRQGRQVAAHLAAGGKKASGWGAFGLGVAGFALGFMPLFILFVFIWQLLAPR